MRDLALTAFVLGLVPLILIRPDWGILAWTWLGLMNPQTMTWGFATRIPFSMIVAIATIASVVLSSEKTRLPLTPVVLTLLALDLWMTITPWFGLFPELQWPMWSRWMKMQVMIFLTLMVMQSKQRIAALVWVSALSVAFFGIKGGLYVIARGGEGMVHGPGQTAIGGNNSIGLALAMTVPLMYWLFLQTRRRWIRFGLVLAIGLCVVASIGTYSRGAFLALAAMACWLWLKSRHKVSLAVLTVFLAVLALHVMPERWRERIDTIQGYQADLSSVKRLNAWHFAWNLASERPLTGGGFNAFQPQAFAIWKPDATVYDLSDQEWHDAHSIWFKMLGEHGFPGLALLVLFWALSWRLTTSIAREARGREELRWAEDLAAAVQVSLVTYWVGGSFLSLFAWDFPFILAAILVLTQVVIRRENLAIAPAKGVGLGTQLPATVTNQQRLRRKVAQR